MQVAPNWAELYQMRHASALLATAPTLWRPALSLLAACPNGGRAAAVAAVSSLPLDALCCGGGGPAGRAALRALQRRCRQLGLSAEADSLAACASSEMLNNLALPVIHRL